MILLDNAHRQVPTRCRVTSWVRVGCALAEGDTVGASAARDPMALPA